MVFLRRSTQIFMTDNDLVSYFISENWKSTFDIHGITEKKNDWDLREKKNLIPAKLKGEDFVFYGFMRPIEIIDFPF